MDGLVRHAWPHKASFFFTVLSLFSFVCRRSLRSHQQRFMRRPRPSSVRPSHCSIVTQYQFLKYLSDFRKIWYSNSLQNFVERLWVSWKSLSWQSYVTEKCKLVITPWAIWMTFVLDLRLMPLNSYECCKNWCSGTVLWFWYKWSHICIYYIFHPNGINFGAGHFHRICSVSWFRSEST
jgi:hypothetical protein